MTAITAMVAKHVAAKAWLNRVTPAPPGSSPSDVATLEDGNQSRRSRRHITRAAKPLIRTAAGRDQWANTCTPLLMPLSPHGIEARDVPSAAGAAVRARA